MAQAPAMPETSWADLLADGRLPRFALICLGVWLTAVDSLITATIMPSVGAELGSYAYFSWAVAGFLVGAILAGASAGRLSEVFGLRLAATISGFVFAIGCMLSAAAPDMASSWRAGFSREPEAGGSQAWPWSPSHFSFPNGISLAFLPSDSTVQPEILRSSAGCMQLVVVQLR